jgi:hypothetical protein
VTRFEGGKSKKDSDDERKLVKDLDCIVRLLPECYDLCSIHIQKEITEQELRFHAFGGYRSPYLICIFACMPRALKTNYSPSQVSNKRFRCAAKTSLSPIYQPCR